ncbi:MAG: glycosyltransferase family 39 protein [Patescibacteria group bacterium]
MKRNFWQKIVLVAIFTIAFLLMIFSCFKDSQTTDEAIHLFAGYTYLTKGDFRLDTEHPPLLKEISALPLLAFKNLEIPLGSLWNEAGNFYYDSWYEARVLSENFFYSLGNDPTKLLFWGRLPFVMLTLLLGFAGFLWAKKLYGMKSGIFAAFLILFFPNILAHGRLINTDLGLTFFMFLTVYLWGNFLKKPNFLNLFFSGLSLGLILSSKFTGLIVLPILFLLFLIRALIFEKQKSKFLLKYFIGFMGALLISFVVIWASYGFSIKTPTLVPPGFIGEYFWGNFQLTSSLTDFLDKARVLFFPAEFYKGIYLVFRHAAVGHSSYLFGQLSNNGWWYYFPVTIFYKTPIPIFFFLIFTIIFWKKIRAKELFDEVLLILPPIMFLVFAMFSKADLGIRHILPIFPFLFVFISKSINLFDISKLKKVNIKTKVFSIVFLCLIAWYFISALISFPNYLAYFNEFAGGQKNGYKILTDSNLDWGQDIYRLKKYLGDNKIEKVYLVYPWDGDKALEHYGINFEPLYSENKNIKGPVVISATYFESGSYSWLKKYPFEQITPGLFIFELN